MQQTDKYKLNKPGVDDPITPVPLNENMDKIEAALDSEVETRAAETAGLDSRVTVLEAHKMVVGSYTATGKVLDITLGFQPVAVFLFHVRSSSSWFISSSRPISSYWHITEDGFSIDAYSNYNGMNNYNEDYLYIAVC